MKSILAAALFLFLTFYSCFGQHCQSGSLNITPGTYTTPGIMPAPDSLPCLIAGSPVSDTLYFTNFTAINGFPLDSLTIDSIGNLPNGLCWLTNSPTNTFGPGQNGVIYISGTCYSAPGQYKLKILIEATGIIAIPPNTNIETETNSRYYLRVECPGSSCIPIDSAGGVDSAYIPYISQMPCPADGVVGIAGQVSGLSLLPVPFSSTAEILFFSDLAGPSLLKIYDLPGKVIRSEKFSMAAGLNKILLERDGLAPGIYLLSINSTTGSTTVRFVVQ